MIFDKETAIRSQATNLKNTMRTQIVSMLKGIVIDQQDDEDEFVENYQMESLFNSDDEFENNILEDSTSDSLSKSSPDDVITPPHSTRFVSKCQTAKYTNQLPLANPSVFMTNQDIERKSKKSVTNVNPSVPASLTAPTPMMPLHTFNFKNSYLKHGKDSSLNANCDQQEQNSNIVIPLIKHKSSVSKGNKNLTSFEAKENYLNNLILQHKHINMEIYNYVKGHFAEYIKNQQTSRLFQYYFNQTHPEVTHLIFTEIYNDLNALLLDSYANYFCLKIFYFLNQNDRFLFLSKIAYNFATLSTNKISTYPIQCILQNLTNPSEQAIIIQGLLMNNNNNANMNCESNIIKLSFDLYGTHVIEKILQYFNVELLAPVINLICNDFLFIANNPNGLCVIKKVIEITEHTVYFEQINEQLCNNALLLIQNPYGNYALQHAFDTWDIAYTERIISQFQSNLLYLSIQKYSSNVIEKCLEKSVPFLYMFCQEIIADSSYNTIVLFLRNTFGNFVLQTILNCVKNTPLQSVIVNAVLMALNQVQEKSILMKWKKKLTLYSNSSNSGITSTSAEMN